MKTTTSGAQVYQSFMRTLHWSMALCIIALFISGAIMVEFDSRDSLRSAFYSFHKSIGALTMALVFIRLIARWTSRIPPLPSGMANWERKLAHAGHAMLYLLMLAVPLTGWATSDVYGYGVKFFALPLPKLFPTLGPAMGAQAGYIHTIMTYVFLCVVVMHLLAIIKHRYIDHDCIMHRMA